MQSLAIHGVAFPMLGGLAISELSGFELGPLCLSESAVTQKGISKVIHI